LIDQLAMNNKSRPKPLSDFVGRCVADVFRRRGFSSFEIVTHWDDIVGPEIAARAEPVRMQWMRGGDGEDPVPATLVVRVEGPAALEIAHQTGIIIERVNRYLGWQAVGGVALRQAPLTRRGLRPRPRRIDDAHAAAIAAELGGIADDGLRAALGRLGAAVKQSQG
jgi:hypothetical protein